MRERAAALWRGLRPLDPVRSVKAKLGLLVVASVVASTLVMWYALDVLGWWPRYTLPVAVVVALAVTQVLAHGMTFPLRQMTAAARRMAAGQSPGEVQASGRDEVGELARAFVSMSADLSTADAQRRDLLANVAHELRTPVAALRAQLENLVDGVRPADPEALTEVLGRAERLGSLLDDLLDLARADAGARSLRVVRVALASVARDVVDEVTALGPGPVVSVRVPPDLTVDADEHRLRQVLSNLVDNAVRHTPARGMVTVAARRVADGVVVEVTDEGPGIPLHERPAVFERFRRGSDGGGTGLGLAIARWAVALHGGRIEVVDSEQGCRIRVTLPQRSAPSPEHPDPDPDPDPPSPTRGARVTDTSPPAPAPPGRPAPADQSPPAAPAAAPPSAPPPSPYPAVPPGPTAPERFWTSPSDAVPLVVLLGAVAVGLAAALTLVAPTGLQYPVLAASGAAVVVLGGRLARTRPVPATSWALATLAVGLAGVAAVSESAPHVVLCLLAAVACLAYAAVDGRSWLSALGVGPILLLAAAQAAPWIARRRPGRRWRVGASWPVVRGVAVAAVVLLLAGALLVSADAAFAELVSVSVPAIDVGTVPARVLLGGLVTSVLLVLAYAVAAAPRWDSVTLPRGRGPLIEWAIPLSAAVALLGAFVAVQVVELVAPGSLLADDTTVAERARQGFGQLVAVTVLMALLLAWTGRRCDDADRRTRVGFGVLAGLLLALVVAVAAVALGRMWRYADAFGLTVLRIDVAAFEVWLVTVLVAVAVLWLARRVDVIPRLVVLSAAGGLLAVAMARPEALAAEWNVDRFEDTGVLDVDHLSRLSVDVVPAVDRLPEPERSCVLRGVLDVVDPGAADPYGVERGPWYALNLSREAARRVGPVEDVACPPPTR